MQAGRDEGCNVRMQRHIEDVGVMDILNLNKHVE